MESYFRDEIRELGSYIPGEQPMGGKAIKMNTNENPYPPSPKVQQAIQEAVSNKLERYPDALGTGFRMRAAEVLGVEPDWILCGNGSDDILTILTRAFVGQGQKIRLPYPSYILYRTLSELQGARFDEVQFDEDFSLGEEFTASDPELKLAFLPNPNSPSGTVVSKDSIRELAGKLACPLLVDEAYADFAESNCIDLVRENPCVMVSRTLSKSYALAGLRFGFLVAQPPVVEMLRKVKDSYNCDALSLAGATAAIDDQDWLLANRAKILATRERMTVRLRELGFEVLDSQANFVWCTHPTQSAKSLYDRLKQDGILVRYMQYPRWGDGLRISVGTDGQVDACLAMLGSYLSS
ncbi:MAG: histidinol-phosphate transaminase [Planctomycetota bacterium]